MKLAVNCCAVAVPVVSVVAVFTFPWNVPEGPLEGGGVNVTTIPLNELLNESVTLALKFVVKTAPTWALCGVPAVAMIREAGPDALVSENNAGVETCGADAVT